GRATIAGQAVHDDHQIEELRRPYSAEAMWVECGARIEALLGELRAAHAVEQEASLGIARAVTGVHAPVRELTLERVRLDDALRPSLFAFLLVLDLDEPALADPFGEGRD